MTIYPNKTDKWLRNLFQMLLNDSEKVRDPRNRPWHGLRAQRALTGCPLISSKRKVNGNERVDFTSQMFNSIIPEHDEFNELVSKKRFSK